MFLCFYLYCWMWKLFHKLAHYVLIIFNLFPLFPSGIPSKRLTTDFLLSHLHLHHLTGGPWRGQAAVKAWYQHDSEDLQCSWLDEELNMWGALHCLLQEGGGAAWTEYPWPLEGVPVGWKGMGPTVITFHYHSWIGNFFVFSLLFLAYNVKEFVWHVCISIQ